MKNVTKLTWWQWDSFSQNQKMMNLDDRVEDIIIMVVEVKYAVAKVLYLRWFLCGGLICEDAAEMVMVGEY